METKIRGENSRESEGSAVKKRGKDARQEVRKQEM